MQKSKAKEWWVPPRVKPKRSLLPREAALMRRGSELLHAAEMRADALMKDAAARAEEAKRMALQESERKIARVAMLAAEKILATRS